jgi:hypothetical protein
MKLAALQTLLFDLIKSIISFLKVALLSKFFTDIKKVQRPHDCCVILGNGPSLNDSITGNKKFLQDKDLFCVKSFPLTKYYLELKPVYYINSAPESYMENVPEQIRQKNQFLYDTIGQQTTWKMTFFIPHHAKKSSYWKNEISKNKNITVVYFNTTPVDGLRKANHLFYRMNLGMPRPHNVLIPTILLALNIGYKEIYLLGADHSWLPEISVDENNRVLVNQKHFYDEEISEPKPMHKLGKGERRLHEVLIKFIYTFRGYFNLKYYAETLSVRIFNATPGSYIDAFDRIIIPPDSKD